MAQAQGTQTNISDETAMRLELENMAKQFPAILAELRRDREESKLWIERSRQRRDQTRLIFDDIQGILGRL